MKTIANITKMVEESESTVRRKYKKLKKEQKISDTDENGRLAEKDVETLLQNLTVIDSQRQSLDSHNDIQFLQKRIVYLENELSNEREHNRKLAEKFVNLTEQAQALHAGTLEAQQKLITSGKPENRRWWEIWKKGESNHD